MRGRTSCGYHLVRPRDLVEAASGLLAVGAQEDARHVLAYLHATQEADGHWPQNMWLDGTPYWNGIQMDETALPVLLIDLCRRRGVLDEDGLRAYWPRSAPQAPWPSASPIDGRRLPAPDGRRVGCGDRGLDLRARHPLVPPLRCS